MTQVLEGIRVLEAATVLAAPGAAALLGDFGAEVIKVEMPGAGDPVRRYPPFADGQSLGSKVTNRNKYSVTLNLNDARGRDLFRQLVRLSDVVIMNFRRPTLESWGLDYEQLAAIRPDLVMLHLTGYGRTGPKADWPGFARIAEAFAGLTYISGYPDRGPMFAGYAIGDGLGAVYGAWSVMLALYERQRSGRGQLIDLALYEPLMRILDHLYIGYDQTGEIPERVGSINPVVAPSDIYATADGQWVVLPVSTPSMFRRLCEAMGRPDLADAPQFRTNADRVAHRTELDAEIRPFIASKNLNEVLELCRAHAIAAGPVYNVAQVMADPQVQARQDIETVWDPNLGRPVRMQGIMPKLSRTPGRIRWPGREPGQDTERVLGELLGLSSDTLQQLRADGVI